MKTDTASTALCSTGRNIICVMLLRLRLRKSNILGRKFELLNQIFGILFEMCSEKSIDLKIYIQGYKSMYAWIWITIRVHWRSWLYEFIYENVNLDQFTFLSTSDLLYSKYIRKGYKKNHPNILTAFKIESKKMDECTCSNVTLTYDTVWQAWNSNARSVSVHRHFGLSQQLARGNLT